MASINRINLAGNLTGDPAFTTTDGGLAVARFGLAVSRGYSRGNSRGDAGKDNGADYFEVVVWKGLAEAVAEHKSKGDAVAIEGRLDYSPYEDAEGRKRSRTRVVAHDVQFIDSAGNGINRLVLLGNLTRDPETRHVRVADIEGVPVTTFGLAMDRVRSQKEDAADFALVECWRELGEIVQENKKRGHGVLVTGRLAHDRRSFRQEPETESQGRRYDLAQIANPHLHLRNPPPIRLTAGDPDYRLRYREFVQAPTPHGTRRLRSRSFFHRSL